MSTIGNGQAAGTPRKRMPRAQRERQMIEVAETVFAEQGYVAASMDDIAERVGVSKPMLYEYFESKEGLLLACIRQARTELYETTLRAAKSAGSAEEALRAGLHAYFLFISERKQAWALLRQEMTLIGTSASDEIEVTRQHQTDMIVGVMRGFVPAAPDQQVDALAEFVVGGCERMAIWSERHADVTPETVTEYAMDLLWAGLARRTANS